MKSYMAVLLLALSVLLPYNVSAQEKFMESRSIWGLEYGLYFESVDDGLGGTAETSMTGPGLNLAAYSFYNHHSFGYYVDTSYTLLVSGSYWTQVGEKSVSPFSVPGSFMMTVIIGAAGRIDINDQTTMRFGFGPSLTLQQSIDIGVGGDMGLDFELSDKLGVSVGTKIGFEFASFENSSWADDYYRVKVAPYISLLVHSLYRKQKGDFMWKRYNPEI